MKRTTNLRRSRKKRKLSVPELAQQTEVSEKIIYELERGGNRADISCVRKLADYFGVSVEWLLTVAEEG